ncbi:MAG TPA: EAL domain-containing protein, partial [Solirubrobacteraceae bacterium]
MQVQDGPGRPARVLLVEDDPQAAMMLGEMLREVWTRGLVVSHAAVLADAAHELLDHGATCVLLDLPDDPSAIAGVEQLSAASPDTPIIVLSDRADEELGVAALRAGAQDYLLKAELNAAVLGRAVRYAIERKRSEVALALQALHDPLTALPNRALFVDRVRVALDRSRRTASPVVVLFLDVDDFKEINDSLGHSAGDRLLTVLADRFRELLRPMDTVARFGGDEFTFLFEGLETEHEAALVADRISRSAGAPVTLGHQQRSIAVSIGVTVVTDPEMAIEDVIRHADTAMYRAKGVGGARSEVFDGRLGAMPGPRAELERALREAVSRSELRVHYQPRVSLNGKTGLEGFEALVRWEHPERGLMAPVDFIPIAEETGLIVPIGEWVLDQALAQVQRWRQSRPGVTISVNLSGRQLGDPGLVDHLMTAMRDGGHDPSVLCLEVAEGALEAEPELAARQLTALHKLGVKLAIDDFGTAISSSVNLSQLPVHILKIDQTLVSRLGEGNGAVET